MKVIFKILRTAIILMSLFVITSCSSQPKHSIEELLPNGVVNADILGVKLPERVETLALKMYDAMERNPEWMVSYIKEHAKPGEPLPYHPNLGLTEKEYEEFLNQYEKRKVVIIGRLPISFRRKGDTVTISSNGVYSFLDGMVINVRNKSIECQFGVLTNPKWQNSSGTTPPIGNWQGYSWYLESGTIESGNIKTLRISLYRLDTGETLMGFKVNLMENHKMIIQQDLNMKFKTV
jgi:hypothetical protein